MEMVVATATVLRRESTGPIAPHIGELAQSRSSRPETLLLAGSCVLSSAPVRDFPQERFEQLADRRPLERVGELRLRPREEELRRREARLRERERQRTASARFQLCRGRGERGGRARKRNRGVESAAEK